MQKTLVELRKKDDVIEAAEMGASYKEKVRIQLVYQTSFKVMIDFFLALVGVIVLLPVLLICAVLTKVTSKGPVFFRQERAITADKTFKIYKFRTMSVEAPHNVATQDLENPDNYITKWGRFMRQTSLDELPQLFNVLKGQMSLIGPRPVAVTEKQLLKLRTTYGLEQTKPGITGLAQISGRDLVELEEKAMLDRQYSENIGFTNDLKIMVRTIVIVFLRIGIREGKTEK
ncbi:sugar transferase [Furfurilactobacillus sp. WILCCON 0119]